MSKIFSETGVRIVDISEFTPGMVIVALSQEQKFTKNSKTSNKMNLIHPPKDPPPKVPTPTKNNATISSSQVPSRAATVLGTNNSKNVPPTKTSETKQTLPIVKSENKKPTEEGKLKSSNSNLNLSSSIDKTNTSGDNDSVMPQQTKHTAKTVDEEESFQEEGNQTEEDVTEEETPIEEGEDEGEEIVEETVEEKPEKEEVDEPVVIPSNLSKEELETLLLKTKTENRDVKKRMRNLLTHIGKYKIHLENEKDEILEEARRMKEDYERELIKLKRVNEDLREELEDTVTDYKEKVEELKESKKKQHLENIENLQTLIKELTLIEASNEKLKSDLEDAQKRYDDAVEEINLSKQVITELETKLHRGENMSQTGSNIPGLDPKKIEQVIYLTNQIKGILLPIGPQDQEDLLVEKLKKEEENHFKTKNELEEFKKALKEERQITQNQQKRITALIQTHTQAFPLEKPERSRDSVYFGSNGKTSSPQHLANKKSSIGSFIPSIETMDEKEIVSSLFILVATGFFF